MKYALYATSESVISAMHKAVLSASSSIYWETFIFRNDTFPTYDFFSIFKEKARSGVKVILIIDGFGGFWYEFGKGLEDELTAAGVEVLFFRSWFRRIHRKILIIDEKRAFIGGVNVAQQYRKWLDLHLFLTGRHIVQSLLRSFTRSYQLCGGTDKRLLSLPPLQPIKKGKLWLLEHWPHADKLLLRRHYIEKIDASRKQLILVTPYFYPSSWLVGSLEKALARGVVVDVLLPRRTEASFSTFANHVFVKLLENSGINFYWSPTMMHAKALLIDDEEGMVGSNNIDQLSFDWNAEAGIFFRRKDMVRDLATIIAGWKKEATIYNSHHELWKWYHLPFAWLVRLLSPVI